MSNPEREPAPYWHEDVAIGEGRFYRDIYTIRARLHTETERFSRRDEIIPLSEPTGRRVYVHAKPYILLPDITLTVALSERPELSGAIGEVLGSEWTGMRQEEIGQAQAWCYPTDRLLVLWECFLEERHRRDDAAADSTHAALWTSFEHLLLTRFPDTERLVTTWEDLYDRSDWHAFLSAQGYEQAAPAAFLKAAPALPQL